MLSRLDAIQNIFSFFLFSCFLPARREVDTYIVNLAKFDVKHSYCRKRCDDDNDDHIALLRFLRLSRKYLGGLAAFFYGGLAAKPVSRNFRDRRSACYKSWPVS